MKRLLVVAAGSIALMSGAAYADGCDFGKHVASDASQSPIMADVSAAEAERLAKLRAMEEQAAADIALEVPIIHN